MGLNFNLLPGPFNPIPLVGLFPCRRLYPGNGGSGAKLPPEKGAIWLYTPSKYGLSPSPDFTGTTLLGLLPTPRSSGQGSAHAILRLKVMAGNVPAEYPSIATRAGEHKTAGPTLRKGLRGGPAAKISYYGIGQCLLWAGTLFEDRLQEVARPLVLYLYTPLNLVR